MAENYFTKLYDIDVRGKTEVKNNLTYLSWASAWAEVKKLYPEATFTTYERTTPDGLIINYFTDGKTCWVKTGVTIGEIEHIEELPVMDFRNKSIPLESLTSCDVNKSIQRSLTKACARHGLGLYIYEKEDLPEAVAKVEDELKTINKETLDIATAKSKESDTMKKKVGTLVRKYIASGNPMSIKDIEKSKELNNKIKELN